MCKSAARLDSSHAGPRAQRHKGRLDRACAAVRGSVEERARPGRLDRRRDRPTRGQAADSRGSTRSRILRSAGGRGRGDAQGQDAGDQARGRVLWRDRPRLEPAADRDGADTRTGAGAGDPGCRLSGPSPEDTCDCRQGVGGRGRPASNGRRLASSRPFRSAGFRSKLVSRLTEGLKRDGRSRPVIQRKRRAGSLPDAATLRSLIEQVPVTVYIDRLDDISSNVYMSPQLEAVLGYSGEEWASDPEFYLKVIHPDDLDRVLTEHRRTRETGDLFSMEYRMVARDGSVHWFLDEARVVRDETGRPAFHHGFILDITERKALEDALQRSEADLRRQTQYYESLLEISPVAVVTLDLEERVTSWNPAAEALFGYSEVEALERPIEALILRTAS